MDLPRMYHSIVNVLRNNSVRGGMTARDIAQKSHSLGEMHRKNPEDFKEMLSELVKTKHVSRLELVSREGKGGDRRSECRYRLNSDDLTPRYQANPHSDSTDGRGIWWSVANRALQKRFGWKEASILAMCGLRISQLDHELGPSGDGELRINTPGAGWPADGAKGPLETLARPLVALGRIGRKRVGKNAGAWLELLGAEFVIQGRLETNTHIDEVREILARCVGAIDDYNARTKLLDEDADKVTDEGAPALLAEPVASREKRLSKLGMTAAQFKKTFDYKASTIADRIRVVESWVNTSQEPPCPSSSPTLSTSRDTLA